MVIVGTMGDETHSEERGMILGLMEPATTIVSSLDYDLARGPRDFDEAGNYRWPFGLELLRAWRFLEPRTALYAISSRRFSMDSTQGIVPLLADEAVNVLVTPLHLKDQVRCGVAIGKGMQQGMLETGDRHRLTWHLTDRDRTVRCQGDEGVGVARRGLFGTFQLIRLAPMLRSPRPRKACRRLPVWGPAPRFARAGSRRTCS